MSTDEIERVISDVPIPNCSDEAVLERAMGSISDGVFWNTLADVDDMLELYDHETEERHVHLYDIADDGTITVRRTTTAMDQVINWDSYPEMETEYGTDDGNNGSEEDIDDPDEADEGPRLKRSLRSCEARRSYAVGDQSSHEHEDC